MIYPGCVGMIYPVAWAVSQLGRPNAHLRIHVCQRVHVVKAVGSKFVSFIMF